MYYIMFLLTVLGLHFLLFSHKHFNWFRVLLCTNKLTGFLCKCPFCSYAWSSLLVSVVVYDSRCWKDLVVQVLSGAIVGLVFEVLFSPYLTKYESNK